MAITHKVSLNEEGVKALLVKLMLPKVVQNLNERFSNVTVNNIDGRWRKDARTDTTYYSATATCTANAVATGNSVTLTFTIQYAVQQEA